MDEAKIKVFIEERLAVLLMILKISPNLRGYAFIKLGVKKIVADNSKKHNVSHRLYQELANDFQVGHENVDRAMRHAIEVSCKRKGTAEFKRRFQIDLMSDRPSPRELLCILAEKIVF